MGIGAGRGELRLFGFFQPIPARCQAMRDGKQVQHPAYGVVDHLFYGLWPVIKAGQGREDDAAHFGHGGHVAQVRQVERGFAHHQHQAAALFQGDIGGAADQVVGQPVRYGGQRLHGAGGDDHAVGLEGAAGDAGADVAHVMHHVRQRFHVLALEVHFLVQVEYAGFRDQQMGLAAGNGAQGLQQAHAVYHAGRSGNGDDQALVGAHGEGGSLTRTSAALAVRRFQTSRS